MADPQAHVVVATMSRSGFLGRTIVFLKSCVEMMR